jgi:Penicillinase repressor
LPEDVDAVVLDMGVGGEEVAGRLASARLSAVGVEARGSGDGAAVGPPTPRARSGMCTPSSHRQLGYTTVVTVMEKLHRKGWLTPEPAGRAYAYTLAFLARVAVTTDDAPVLCAVYVARSRSRGSSSFPSPLPLCLPGLSSHWARRGVCAGTTGSCSNSC